MAESPRFEDTLSLEDTALRLGLTIEALKKAVQRRQIPAYRFLNKLRFDPKDIVASHQYLPAVWQVAKKKAK